MNIKNMRERFDDKFTYASFTWNGDNATGVKFAKDTKKKVLDFIEQELKKEREEIIKIIESMRVDWDNEMVNTIDWKDANDWTIDNIMNKLN